MQEHQLYEFGRYRLIPAERLLLRDGEPVPLTPKAFETLVALVRRAGRLAEKSELLNEVWPGTSVEESNVAQNIFTLRRVFSRHGDGAEYIETIPKRGYRFLPPVTVLDDAALSSQQHALAIASPSPHANAEAVVAVAAPADDGGAHAATPAAITTDAVARPRTRLLGFLAVAVLLAGVSFFAARVSSTPAAPQPPPRAITLTRLMSSDSRIPSAAISPDGRYFAHVVESGDGTSILLRQLSTLTDLTIVPLERGAWHCALSFSPDGDAIYYVKRTSIGVSVLYRVSTLGGTPQKILEHVDSHAAVSPDGKQLAFVRDEAANDSLLMIAGIDGTGERVLARRRRPQSHFSSSERGGPSWSPDGSTIATGVISLEGGYHGELVNVSVADGSQTQLSTHRWNQVAQVAWLADGSGLMVAARDGAAGQIWHVAYPGGAARKIVTDLNDHHNISMTSDSRLLMAVQYDRRSTLAFIPELPHVTSKRSTEGMDEGYYGLSWTPEGELVYASDASGNHDLWLLARDGVSARRLTTNPEHDSTPFVSPDGRLVVFLSRRHGGNPHVWRMDLDGGNQRQLTNQTSEGTPSVTPDGQWVVYAVASAGIWKVPVDGGQPVQISAGEYHTPSVSPDGTQVVCFARNRRGTGPDQLAVLPMTPGAPVKWFDMPEDLSSPTIRWTADGRSLLYIATHEGSSALRAFPLDGKPAQTITSLAGARVFNFARSPHSEQLAVARITTADHVVLIRDFR